MANFMNMWPVQSPRASHSKGTPTWGLIFCISFIEIFNNTFTFEFVFCESSLMDNGTCAGCLQPWIPLLAASLSPQILATLSFGPWYTGPYLASSSSDTCGESWVECGILELRTEMLISLIWTDNNKMHFESDSARVSLLPIQVQWYL